MLAAVSGLWQPNVFFPLDFPGSDPCTILLSLIFWGQNEAAPLNQLSLLFLFCFVRLRISGITSPPFTSSYKRWDADILAVPAAADCGFCWMLFWWSCHHQSNQRNQIKARVAFALAAELTMTQLVILFRSLLFGLYHGDIPLVGCVSQCY